MVKPPIFFSIIQGSKLDVDCSGLSKKLRRGTVRLLEKGLPGIQSLAINLSVKFCMYVCYLRPDKL